MIADMDSSQKLSPSVTELLLRGRKLSISVVFISQSYFKVLRHMRLNAAHYFTVKIINKRELKIASNHLSDIEFKNFHEVIKVILKNHFHF